MSWSKAFEELSRSKHDRDSFDCGESELNIFIQIQAVKPMQVGISRTMVLPGTAPLLYQKFGFQMLCEQSGRVRMFLPMKTVGQLFG